MTRPRGEVGEPLQRRRHTMPTIKRALRDLETMTNIEVGKLHDVNPRTVNTWRNRYRSGHGRLAWRLVSRHLREYPHATAGHTQRSTTCSLLKSYTDRGLVARHRRCGEWRYAIPEPFTTPFQDAA
jgi:DNA-binding transcriptional ArsR family regulator